MSYIGRNEPCPCGSGKKYKKCCMAAEEPKPSPSRKPAPRQALDWLSKYHADDIQRAIDKDYLGWMTDKQRHALFSSDESIQSMFNINLGEWLLVDAVLRVGGKRVDRKSVV